MDRAAVLGMSERLRFALLLTLLLTRASSAQVRVVSAPPEPSLLVLTQQWSRESILGDPREMGTGPDYLELRVWGGFTLTTPTQGVVLRRSDGRWSAFLARVMRCETQIPIAVGDTATRATMQRYIADARQHCVAPVANVGPGVRIITTDSLLVERLDVPDSIIANAWTAADHAGVSDLPARVEHKQQVDDPFTFVVELRHGNDYRASAIAYVEPPETDADRQIRAVYDAVNRVLPPQLMLKPESPHL
jgi:hypothetical protein